MVASADMNFCRVLYLWKSNVTGGGAGRHRSEWATKHPMLPLPRTYIRWSSGGRALSGTGSEAPEDNSLLVDIARGIRRNDRGRKKSLCKDGRGISANGIMPAIIRRRKNKNDHR